MSFKLKDVNDWGEANGESADTLRALRRVPARLGMLDADLVSISVDPIGYDLHVVGLGYSLFSRAKDMEKHGRHEGSRVQT